MRLFKYYFMPRRKQTKLKVRIETKKKIHKIDDGIILEKKISKDSEDIERKKILLMRAGVICIMVIFFAAWIFNLKHQFKINSNNNDKSLFNWEQAKAELDKAMSHVKQGVNDIKQIQATNQQRTLPREQELTVEQINLLKGKLMSQTTSNTTASSTKN